VDNTTLQAYKIGKSERLLSEMACIRKCSFYYETKFKQFVRLSNFLLDQECSIFRLKFQIHFILIAVYQFIDTVFTINYYQVLCSCYRRKKYFLIINNVSSIVHGKGCLDLFHNATSTNLCRSMAAWDCHNKKPIVLTSFLEFLLLLLLFFFCFASSVVFFLFRLMSFWFFQITKIF